MINYFAYGSNLCYRRFIGRVPSARFVAVAKLPKFRVVFHKRSNDGSGKATCVNDSEGFVHGVIYEFAEEHLDAIRRAEGFPNHYREENVFVLTQSGERLVMTYLAASAYYDETQVPYDWYVDLIRVGGNKLGLSEKFSAQFSSTITKKDADLERDFRERKFLEEM